MTFEILLGAALEAGLGLLAAAGFEDEIKAAKERLLQTDLRKRQRAFEDAVQQALDAVGEPSIESLLSHRPIQEEIVAGLLDPVNGFDIQVVADDLGERFPRYARPFRRFFPALENALLADDVWGPILDRYQDLRLRKDIQQALGDRRLDIPPGQVVRQLTAQLYGSGGIAQEHGVAAGERGVAVGGNVHQIVQLFVEKIVFQAGGAPAPESLRGTYLGEVARDANLLPWLSINEEFATPERGESLRLADIYTDLDTTALRRVRDEGELRAFLRRVVEADRIPALEMADKQTRLLIMGDPGSGKSTFVKHFAYTLAQAGLAADPAPWEQSLAGWTHGVLLPVRIELRALAAWAAASDVSEGGWTVLWDYVRRELDQWRLSAFADELAELLRDPDVSIVFLLDGLDEVPTEQRQFVVDVVNAFSSHYDQHRYIVTCRPYAYVGQPWQLTGFHEATLAPFSQEQVDHFIENWYEQLSARRRIGEPDARRRAHALQQSVRRDDLRSLAERPLLLTIMAQLHSFTGELPEDRTQLYADAVDLLLRRWEGRTGGDAGLLKTLAIPGLKYTDLQAGIYCVAYSAHEHSGDDTADITEGALREGLAPYLGGDWEKAGLFVQYIRERAGLLIRHKTDAYTFPHRTFQEFLTACHLVTGRDDYPADAAELVREDSVRWREVFVLAAGYAAHTHKLGQAIGAVNALCPRDCQPGQHYTSAEWQYATLAGESLLEIGLMGVQRSEAGRASYERVRDRLLAAMHRYQGLSPVDRAAAGRVLSRLGDPRIEVMDPLNIEWVDIPAGPFVSGEGNKQHTNCGLTYAYQIGRYPVTNAQFQAFVDAGGYAEPEFWSEAEESEVWNAGRVKGKSADDLRREPAHFGEPFSLDNHPVVGITWYEAVAFCRWLSKASHSDGTLLLDYDIRLPSETEWEKAARGEHGQQYPWSGDEDESNCANHEASKVAATSAVGCFTCGRSPYGAEEMAGNVWEWTDAYPRTSSKPAHSDRKDEESGSQVDTIVTVDVPPVLRGGSWLDDKSSLRCAVRLRQYPRSHWGNYLGFRAVKSSSTL